MENQSDKNIIIEQFKQLGYTQIPKGSKLICPTLTTNLVFTNNQGGYCEFEKENYFIYPIGNISIEEVTAVADNFESIENLEEPIFVGNAIFETVYGKNNLVNIDETILKAIEDRSGNGRWRA